MATLCVAVHQHKYGTSAQLFYVDNQTTMPRDETVQRVLRMDVDSDSSEDFATAFIENQPTEEIPGVPFVEETR